MNSDRTLVYDSKVEPQFRKTSIHTICSLLWMKR